MVKQNERRNDVLRFVTTDSMNSNARNEVFVLRADIKLRLVCGDYVRFDLPSVIEAL